MRNLHPIFQNVISRHLPGIGDYEYFPRTSHPLDPRNDNDPCECGECDECRAEMKALGILEGDEE